MKKINEIPSENGKPICQEQQPPFTVVVEPTEGCNRGCSFCSLRSMRKNGTKPWYFMTIDTATRIADEIKRVGWKAKIVFANHGEPTLNSNFFEIVSIFRERLPKSIFHMYTNGIVISNIKNPNKYIKDLFAVGMNDILLDCYDDKSVEFLKKIKHDNIVKLEKGVEYYTSKHEQRILLVPSIIDDQDNKMTRRLENQAGYASPRNRAYNNKRCAFPFREMAIRWDGNVCICCNDFRGAYLIGNINDMDIEDIWQHPKFRAARIMLYNHNRNFMPCDGCDTISMRVGFLPDSSGQMTMPKITEEVKRTANNVFKKNGYVSKIIIKREWE